MPLLAAEEVRNLDTYKYSGKDYSLSSKYFMNAYWGHAVGWVPMTIAPNLITLLGFAISSSTSLLLLYFANYNASVIPSWLWVWAAVSLFAYQTLDALDGKQARRTGCGSPLGELFDHGCDALFTPLLCITTCLAVNYTPLQSFVHCTVVCCGLFLSLFEQYSTGTLDLGYINGPVEGILMTCVSFLWTAYAGPAWWSSDFATPLLEGRSVAGVPLTLYSPRDVILVFTVMMAVATAFTNLLHAFTMRKAHGKIHRLPVLSVPIVLVAAMTFLVRDAPELVVNARYPFALELSFGWFVSYTVTRMTVARLCKCDYRPITVPFVALTVLFAGLAVHKGVTGAVHEHAATSFVLSAVFIFIAYLKMIVGVFSQFARYLNINVLTMTPVQRARVLKAISEGKHHVA